MKKYLVLGLLVCSCFIQAQDTLKFTDLYGDYLGQTPPGDTPVVFAHNIVSTNQLEHSAPAFSPAGNEIFWSLWRHPENVEPQVIMTMRREGGVWSEPDIAPFSGEYVDGGPTFSADGRRLYFGSANPAKPAPGYSRIWDIWFVEKQDKGWSERRSLDLLARFPYLRSVESPSIARNGTIYFMEYTPGPLNDSGIYRAELVNGKYTKPQLLPPSINDPSGILTWTPFIAPDESYLLFSSNRHNPESDYGDIWISWRNSNGNWSDPVMLPESINSRHQERFPMVSPDGKYLFFTRWTPEHNHDVLWVNAKIIEKIKDEINY